MQISTVKTKSINKNETILLYVETQYTFQFVDLSKQTYLYHCICSQ